MAAFQVVKYTADSGVVYRCTASDQTIAAPGNTAVTGALTGGRAWAVASNPGSKRKRGLNMRGLRLERFTGTGAARKRFTTFMPVFSPVAFEAYVILDDIVLAGGTWQIADKIDEA